MRLVPVRAHADIHLQRHAEHGRAGHVLLDSRTDLVDGIGSHFEDEFIVHLHQQAHVVAWLDPCGHGDHGALDDVRGRALHGRIDRRALGTGAERLVTRTEVLEVKAAAEQRLHVTVAMGLLARGIHEGAHAGIA